MSRVTERANFDQPTRMSLAESDLDSDDEEKETIRQAVENLREDMNKKFDVSREDMNKRFDASNKYLMGILGGVATGAILVAIDIVRSQ